MTQDPFAAHSTRRCCRCGQDCAGGACQNLTGWEGRQLAIERTRWYCTDIEVCCARRFGTEAA